MKKREQSRNNHYQGLAAIALGIFVASGTISTQFTSSDNCAVLAASKAKTQTSDKTEKTQNKPPVNEPPIENVVNVTTTELVDKPNEYLNKNVKFTAKFFAFNNLALDFKPAMRSSRTHLSFIVLRPEAHVPYSELKLAVQIPKEKEPESLLLASLKEGDQIEIIGKVFATPLDEPWLDVLRLKKLSSSSDEKKEDKKASTDTDSDSDKH